MAEVIANHSALSDSTFKTRPNFRAYLQSDTNASGNSVQQIEQKRLERQMKFPSLMGRKDVDSFRQVGSPEDAAYRKWNDEGDFRPPAPFRSCDSILDPISGFISPGGDVDRNTGHTRIQSLVQLNTTPQSYNPQDLNSIRLGCKSAPPDTLRLTERDPGSPYAWSSKKVLDSSLRAGLGGWTSEKDPRKSAEDMRMRTPAEDNKVLRDKLALQYMYTSSTQRSYEEVSWDTKVPPKRWAPVSTLEQRPDMVSQCFTNKRYDPSAQQYQNVGRSWDRFQTRVGHFKTHSPIPGIVYCSPCPRAQQIPLYGGCMGGTDPDAMDDPGKDFQPLTVKRVPIPRPSQTAHRPNIPGYAGCTQYRSDSQSAHAVLPTPPAQTTARVHRSIPPTPQTSEHRRDSQMSRMITTVPPCNPYNLMDNPALTVGVTG